MTEEQQKKFEKWLEPHIKDHGHDFAGGFYIETALGEHLNIGTDEHDAWVTEMRNEFLKAQPPKAGVVYVPWIIQSVPESESSNDDRKTAVDIWNKEHEACPKCFNTSLMTTLAGPIWHVGEPYVDNINTAHCAKCNWTGKVNQLIPKQDV